MLRRTRSAAAAPPQPPILWRGFLPEDADVHRKAQRFARLLVDEIKLYNQAKVAEGRRNKDLYDRLKEDIDKSRGTFQKRYGSTAAASGDYFQTRIAAQSWPKMTFPSWVRISATSSAAGSGSSVSLRKRKIKSSAIGFAAVLVGARSCSSLGLSWCPASGRVEARAIRIRFPSESSTNSSALGAAAQGAASTVSSQAKVPSKKPPVKKPSPTSAKRHYANARRLRTISPRVRRMRQAFVASASLRPMAQQLLLDRSLPAYAGVEAYARAHAKEDAGALAWLVVGYAHVLDKDYAKAIDPLNRAKVHAGDLGDYVSYYLGTSYLQTGRTAEAVANLADFGKAHPDSLLTRDAAVGYADALLLEGQPSEAATLLEPIRAPTRSDVEFALGRAYAASGQNAKAADTLANIYYTMPTSAEADAAYAELKKLPNIPPPTVAQRKMRADALMSRHRYPDAAEEYRSLATEALPSDRVAFRLALADALHRGGRNRDAKQELATLDNVTGEANAQRLYLVGQVAWAANDNDAFYRTVDELRQSAPTSPWLEQALISAANLHLVHHEYDQALDVFREAQQRFPNGARASYLHWKAAWLTLRQGRNDDAKKAFEEQIALYPAGAETPAALYWRARLAEEDNQPVMARAFYQKLSDRYRNFYYAELARERMKQLPPATDATTEFPLLDRVPPSTLTEK